MNLNDSEIRLRDLLAFDFYPTSGPQAHARFRLLLGVDDVTVLLCGSLQTHLGTLMPSGGGHIINARLRPWYSIKGCSAGLLDGRLQGCLTDR